MSKPQTITFDVNYYSTGNGRREWSHKYTETWLKLSDRYCLNCGKQEVWHNEFGDYEAGEQHICAACRFTWWMSVDSVQKAEDDTDIQRITAIKKCFHTKQEKE